MWKPIYQPEPWPQFRKRKDIVSLPLMEQRKKYMQEQLLFENYLSTLNTLNTVSPSVSSAASGGGGPKPSAAPTGPIFPKYTIDTQYNFEGDQWGLYTKDQGITKEDVFFLFGWGTYQGNKSPDFTEAIVDWGDGNVEVLTNYNFSFIISDIVSSNQFARAVRHTYSTPGSYTISITGDGAYDLRPSTAPIVDILSFDQNAYNGTQQNPVGPSLRHAFYGNRFLGMSENSINAISNWDVSQVIDFAGCFAGIIQSPQWLFRSASEQIDVFPEPLPNVENWDVSSAKEITRMFSGRVNFSQSLANWDVSNCSKGEGVFYYCENLVSGARADLWNPDLSAPWYSGWYGTFRGSMTSPSARGTMPHIGNWNLSNIPEGSTNYFYDIFKDSGFSHTAVGETLIGWASQSAVPNSIGVASSAFSNTWDGSGFSNPSYDTGSAFGLEVSASYDYLVTTKGWTIPNFTFS